MIFGNMFDSFFKIWTCLLIVNLIGGIGIKAIAQEQDVVEKQSIQSDSLVNELPLEMQKFLEAITTENEKTSSVEPSLEIDGLVVDETRTKAGHDFYDQFYSLWEAPPQAANFSILIREIPFRVNITQLQILVNDELVVNSILQPKQEFIGNLASEAVPAIAEYLIKLQEMARQLDETDLSGSGIY